ncbi:UNVERIFIED_CONTAM: hypothetical protein FKN15_026250 [Acipenser sinensis]
MFLVLFHEGQEETCSFEGQEYQDGEEWKPTPCSKCICNNGASECYAAECHPVVCKKDENLIIYPGKCCPQCVTNSCLVSKKEYKHGEQWKKNACTTCICDGGEARCHTQTCPANTCEKGQNKVKRAGQCCEECVSSKGNCLYEGSIRYHGEMWNGTGCEFCMCERGQVMCQKAECAKVECIWNFERWREGLCRECECRDSQALCFQRSCPSCPVGTLAVAVEGECCPQCRPACHQTCRSCVGPKHSDCTQCLKPEEVLHSHRKENGIPHGVCVSECKPQLYLDTDNICKDSAHRYHPCTDSGAAKTSTRCPQKRVPSADRFFTHCRLTMQPPRATALEDNAALGSLEASPQAPGQTTGVADCQLPVQRCVADLQNNGNVCLWCKDPRGLLLGEQCVPECPSGYYTDRGACKRCHSSCKRCSGGGYLACTSCEAGLVLSHSGLCSSHCYTGYYSDENRVCQACNRKCLTCESAGSCTSCRDPQKVLLFRECQYESCAQQYYLDFTSRTCKANTQAPVLHVNGSLIVKIGGTKPLDFSFMSAHDPDSSAENLMFYLVQLPDNGRLVKMVKGKEVRLNRDDTFTFRDLREQAVRFIHAKEKSKSGQFILKVSDQQLFSQPKSINVQAVSLQAPYVLTNEALLVSKGEAGTISSLLLKIEDDDNLQDILVMVLDPPKHGRLVRLHGDVAVQQFRPDDLERGQLQYVHDGTDSQQDLVLLQMNDGHSFQNILFQIKVNQKV